MAASQGRGRRNKGKAGEREFANFCKARDVEARRGQQFRGDVSAPDVVLEDYPDVYLEVKRCEQSRVFPWMTQAIAEAMDKVPVLAHRRNGTEWICIMRAHDWVELIRKAYGDGRAG